MTPTESKKPSLRGLLLTEMFLFIFPLLLLGLSGDWRWREGLIFSAWFLLSSGGTVAYPYFKDPELYAERRRRPKRGEVQAGDRRILLALFVLYLVWFVFIPLDAVRFHWTPNFPLGLRLLGGIFLLSSTFFIFRSFVDNTFLSSVVRLQEDRKQQVVSTGVYGIVRHPMYLGMLCSFLGAPLFLGSYVGLVIGLTMGALLAARIIGEEHLLVDQLEGYADYRQKVRYRMVPLVW
ncbi:MAG TPA: isoprenylcysteine carboxylmethyltransferase family protein [Stenomitos sp.]